VLRDEQTANVAPAPLESPSAAEQVNDPKYDWLFRRLTIGDGGRRAIARQLGRVDGRISTWQHFQNPCCEHRLIAAGQLNMGQPRSGNRQNARVENQDFERAEDPMTNLYAFLMARLVPLTTF
jgi:hypothetical protein